jgi:hypothetical protein
LTPFDDFSGPIEICNEIQTLFLFLFETPLDPILSLFSRFDPHEFPAPFLIPLSIPRIESNSTLERTLDDLWNPLYRSSTRENEVRREVGREGT